MNIDLTKRVIDKFIETYNKDVHTQELEIIFNNVNINTDKLGNILQFLTTESTIKSEDLYILTIFIDTYDKYSRFVFESDKDILKTNCLNEKTNIVSNTFPEEYTLEKKEVVLPSYNIDIINLKMNLKTEKEIDREDFIKHYKKFTKKYRLKKRKRFDFEDFYVDISVVKNSSGNNILQSRINSSNETIEIEVEAKSKEINLEIVKNMINIGIKLNQICNNGYYIFVNKKDKGKILAEYNSIIRNILPKTGKNIGPKPISFTKKTISNMIIPQEQIVESKLEVKENKLYYLITEKADGDRYTLFINKESRLFLINDNNDVLITGIELLDNEYNNSNIDGEYIS